MKKLLSMAMATLAILGTSNAFATEYQGKSKMCPASEVVNVVSFKNYTKGDKITFYGTANMGKIFQRQITRSIIFTFKGQKKSNPTEAQFFKFILPARSDALMWIWPGCYFYDKNFKGETTGKNAKKHMFKFEYDKSTFEDIKGLKLIDVEVNGESQCYNIGFSMITINILNSNFITNNEKLNVDFGTGQIELIEAPAWYDVQSDKTQKFY